MDNRELLKNIKEIRKNLEQLNKMVGVIFVNIYPESLEESSGQNEKDITDVIPRRVEDSNPQKNRSYLG